jgi:hypothetical protein
MMTVEYTPGQIDGSKSLFDKDSEFSTLERNIEKIVISDDRIEDRSLKKSSQLTIKVSDQSTTAQSIDPFEFVTIQRFSDNKPPVLTSPRSSHVTFTENDVCELTQYDGMKQWFGKNISNFMNTKDRWPRHVYPERLLYVYGPRGMGRLTRNLLLCRDAGVNFLFVPITSHNSVFFSNVIKKAKEIQPCVVFFDDSDYIFNF